MNEDQNKAFEDQLDLLPQAYQEVVRSYPWEERTISVGRDAGLYLNDIEDLTAEVALVLVGITQPEDFHSTLVSRLMISDEKASEVERGLNLMLFNPIREAVQKRTLQNQDQFMSAPSTGMDLAKAPAQTPETPTSSVFKVAPEKYSVSTTPTPQTQKKLQRNPIDPYREPIE